LSPEPGAIAELHFGHSPLIISLPHVGTALPPDIAAQMTAVAATVIDTDWHVHRLYEFARQSGASWLQARISRYAIDLNRPTDDHSLYPGQTTSALCPTATFAGEPLYHGAAPSAEEIGRRRDRYWLPYHTMLRELIAATRTRFGYALLLDAHSIRSELPRLFDGHLPDINVGTNDGKSCNTDMSARLMGVLNRQTRFSYVLNGRFKGGHITRTYGDPTTSVHAVQIELAQSAYMDESTSDYDADRAQPLQRLLQQIVNVLREFVPAGIAS
jgi:N-formylglutamate deformylase